MLKELLELVAREKTRINEKKNHDEISARAIEFDNGGMHNCPLSFGTNSELEYHIFYRQYQKYLEIFIIYIHSYSTKETLINNDMDTSKIENY